MMGFKSSVAIATFSSIVYLLVGCFWPMEFWELDLTSKFVTIVFQRILPSLVDCETSFASLQRRRSFLNGLSQTSNFIDELLYSQLSTVYTQTITPDDSRDGPKIGMRLYWTGMHASEHQPPKQVLIWFHGGGWLSGDIDQDDTICKRFADWNNYLVVNVDYRLSPEFTYPAPIDDGFSTLDWVGRNIHRFGGDPSQVILGGESAGGHLAAAVASKYFTNTETQRTSASLVKIVSLLLVYPALDYTSLHFPPLSPISGMLPLGHIEHMRTTFAGPMLIVQTEDYIFAPFRAPDSIMKKFPPTVLVLAKHDVLAREGLEYAARLKENGVSVYTALFNQSIHIFFGRWAFQEGLLALDTAARLLREATEPRESVWYKEIDE